MVAAHRGFMVAAVIVSAMATSIGACQSKYGASDADDGGSPSRNDDASAYDDRAAGDGGSVAPPVDRCAEIPDASPDPSICNGDFGSAATKRCPEERQICSETGSCMETCSTGTNGSCTRPPGHAGTSCEIEIGNEGARCGLACSGSMPCPTGLFCDTGVGRLGNVCVRPLRNGTVFGDLFGARPDAGSCADLGSRACVNGHGNPLDTGGCICASTAGSACASDTDCADSHCGADRRCGGKIGDLCSGAASTPYGVSTCRSNLCAGCVCAPACSNDADCGNLLSGKVCNGDSACVAGCRATNGNGCPYGQACTSNDASVGRCIGDGGA